MDEQREICGDEVNLFEYVRTMMRHKVLICYIVGTFVIGTAIISLIMTPTYEAKAVIMTVKTSDVKEGMMAVASQFGIAGPEQTQKTEIMGLLKSNFLKERMIRKYNLLPVLVKPGAMKRKTEEEKLWMGIRFLDKNMKITAKQKDNTIEIVMRFKDKKIVADIVRYTLLELTDVMSAEEKRVADGNRKHLESTIDQTPDPFVRTSIYNLIAKQVEKSAMAEATENFAFKVLDPPRIPDKRVWPKRTVMVVLAFVVGLIVAVFASFAKEYWTTHKQELRGMLR
jgi:uncharacterized protein involved in exopolysaccharide biosynthesis